MDLRGKRLQERYTIEERLAQGGMSVVYRAVDERLQRPVCAKVFFGLDRAQALYQTTYEHFVQEAFALSQLSHPNTLRIYDFGYLEEEPRSPYHVSELMDGGTLLGHMRRHGALPPAEALGILEPIVGALGEAHSRGIVHRDIKPSNILFGSAGPHKVVKLADFGIAKATLDEASRAIPNRAQDTNAAAGMRVSLYSPGWAAPEQLRAQPVGPSADVFALGLLLAHMLTGRKLFTESDFSASLEQRSQGDDHVARAVAGIGLPGPFVDVVLHACRLDPSARPQSAADLWSEAKRAGHDASFGPDRLPTERFDRVALAGGASIRVVADLSRPELTVGRRRVRLVAIPAGGVHVDLGGDEIGPARLRVTLSPDVDRGARIHLRGLNCFVSRARGRPTGALDLDEDTEIELRSPGRETLDAVRVAFGVAEGEARLFESGEGTVVVPGELRVRSVMLDFGPGRELVLIYAGSG